MIEELAKILSKFSRFESSSIRVVRVEESRFEKPYEYFEYTAEDKQVKFREPLIHVIDTIPISKYMDLYAIDSSSRVIDTPYVFIAVGAVTAVNRFKRRVLDYPNISSLLLGESMYDFIVVVPELEIRDSDIYIKLRELGITTCNPAGLTYTPTYNKYVILDELRLKLENIMLEKLLDIEHNSIVFLDGTIYYTPPLVYQANELHGVRDEHIEHYIRSWSILVSERIKLIDKLVREKGTSVYGIVKRLNKSNLLSRVDPLNISSGRVNDEVYLSITTSLLKRKYGVNKPFYIGPIEYNPGKTPVKLPTKQLYYVAIPRRGLHSNVNRYGDYAYYRIEVLRDLAGKTEDQEILTPILLDSLSTGSSLPLTLLLADNRAKKLSHALVNYILRAIGIPTESTRFYITL
ncbi:MAG: DNA double-strand break repair nuclease NurA [Thermoprotei archaeon]